VPIVNLLDVRGNGYLRIDQLLKSSSLMAVEAKADCADFEQLVHHREQAGGFGVEGQKDDVGETWLAVIHKPPRPFPGDPPHMENGCHR
jgi:hypothetical protein